MRSAAHVYTKVLPNLEVGERFVEKEKTSEKGPVVRGLFEVLLILRDGRRTFLELKRIAHMSPSTVLKRLRESQENGWVKQDLTAEKARRPKIKYSLTAEGRDLLDDYKSIIDKYVELKTELDELEKALRDKEKQIKYLLLHAADRSDRSQIDRV